MKVGQQVVYKNFMFSEMDDNQGESKFAQERFIRNVDNNILKDNKFTILCEIYVGEDTTVENHRKFERRRNSYRLREFDRFEKVLKKEEFSDVTIRAEGKSFYLHKCILTSCSDVFDAMFRNNMMEKKQNLVEIDDISSEVLEKFFQFIYTGKVNEIEQTICELLTAAEKYHVEGLKLLCEETMNINLNKDNAIEYLNSAIKNNSDVLQSNIMNWISLHLKDLIGNPSYDEFVMQHPKVFLEIIKKKFCM